LLWLWVIDVMRWRRVMTVRRVLELHHVLWAGWDNRHGKTMRVWVVWNEMTVVLPALQTLLGVVIEE
jgi:hypothetical protein